MLFYVPLNECALDNKAILHSEPFAFAKTYRQRKTLQLIHRHSSAFKSLFSFIEESGEGVEGGDLVKRGDSINICYNSLHKAILNVLL